MVYPLLTSGAVGYKIIIITG